MSFLTNKVAIITGASAGIGEATAILFAERKANIVLVARNKDNLEKVAEKCIDRGLMKDKILVAQCDVTEEGQVETLVKNTLEKFHKIDILVNNAGIGKYTPILETKLEDLDQVMKTNVRAPFHITQLCLPHLIETKGSVINVSSISGQRPFPTAITYCMSKAALDHFTKTLSVEFAPKGVRINSVNPGVIITDFQRNSGMPEENYQTYLQRQKDLQPLCGAIEPVEVAKAIAFFASDEAACITGETMFIDGGRHAKPPL